MRGSWPFRTIATMTTETLSRPRSGTVAHLFLDAVARSGDRVAVRTLDDACVLSWNDLAERVAAAAGGLRAVGVGRGDSVALLMTNRPEFWVADLAVTMVGATPFSLYQTSPPPDVEYLIGDAGARTIIVERRFLEVLRRSALPAVEHVIVVDGESHDDAMPLARLERSAAPLDLASAAAALDPTATAMLIYTSGTSGRPKGVELTHRNLLASVRGLSETFPVPAGARVISWLPAAHVMERVLHYLLPIALDCTVTTCPDPRQIAFYLSAVHPDVFIAVPRVWDKLKVGIEASLAGLPAERRVAAQSALAAALQRLRLRQASQTVPAELEAAVQGADRALFAALRERLGLDRVTIAVVGAAPCGRETLEFFHAIGIELIEAWAMSETACLGVADRPGQVRIGTVGRPLPGLEARLAADGEVLVRGESIMSGYRAQPEATRAAIDPDGWLHTGDIGAIDDDGNLSIVDRKKELIITAGGKNISPAHVESELKAGSPLIGHACAVGDRRPYLVALIALDPDTAGAFAARHGPAGIQPAVEQAIARANERLARVEQIKRFAILPGDWTPGGPELTPTMKLKRRAITERYRDQIEALYQ
jgi:long-subunit acyl-CoA synthetase (AMP-forming)